MKRNPEISHRSFGGSGPLSIYWAKPPYGYAKDCVKGRGVCWESDDGVLLAVEFDDVADSSDSQFLVTSNGTRVDITTKNGKSAVTVRSGKTRKRESA